MKIVIVFALAALAVGCAADPRAANNANFQRAIDASLAKPQSRLCINSPVLPYKMIAEQQPYNVTIPEGVERPGATPPEKLDALVDAKLAVKRTVPLAVSVSTFNPHTFRNEQTSKTIPEIVYEATPDFSKYATTTSGIFMNTTSLCFASLQVDHVDNFSEPGQAMGATVSSVYYRAKAIDVAPWSTNAAMVAAFPEITTEMQQATGTQTFSRGGTHERRLAGATITILPE
jgi:hypothetical protein